MNWNLPNTLSALRIAAAPTLVLLGWLGATELFLTTLWMALLSDAADGYCARRSGQSSELGACLDSWGDWLLYAALPAGVAMLWPELARREMVWVGVALAVLVVPSAVGFLKFGRLTSYHTYLAKITGVLMAGGAVALLQWDYAGLFHLAVCFLAIEGVEELLITAELPAWRSDVRSFRSALRLAEADAVSC